MPTNEQQILAQFVGEARQNLDLKDDTRAFEYLCIQEVVREFDLSAPELEDGFLDGGGDSGIDAAYIFVNEQLYSDESLLPSKGQLNIVFHVITSQYVENFKEKPLTSITTAFDHLLNLSLEDDSKYGPLYSSGVYEFFRLSRSLILKTATRKPNIEFNITFSTRNSPTEPSHRVHAQAGVLRSNVESKVPGATVETNLIGAKEVLELIRRPQVFTKDLNCDNILSAAAGNGWIAIVKISKLHRFLSDDAGELQFSMFDANVRDYQGETLVNEGIVETLNNHAENPEFWWFNNGVTIVCDGAVPRGQTLILDSPLIVNGLQTSTIIYHHFSKEDAAAEDERAVIVRVIVPPDETVRDKIIRATNSQNNIPAVYLRGTDKIHRDIEDYLKPKGYFYERRKNSYRNLGAPRTKIVTLGELAQAGMAAILMKASAARARPNSLIRNDSDYNSIFSETYPMELFKRVIDLLKACEDRIGERATDLGVRDKNNIKYHVMMVWSIVAQQGATDKIQNFIDSEIEIEILDDIVDHVVSIYKSLGATDAIAKGPTFQSECITTAPELIAKLKLKEII